ncbi:MAG: PQ-loop domain-containing transporter [Acidimicrobiia bacterium]
MDAAGVLGPICTALSVGFVWPQVIRIYRLDSVEGLSPYGTMQGLTGCALWTAYGINKGIGPIIISNGAIGAAMVMIAAAQVRHKALSVRRLAVLALVVGAVIAVTLSISVTLEGSIAIVVGVTSMIPQALYVTRTEDLSALSLPMYGLVLLSVLLWTAYALVLGDTQIIITNALIAPFAFFVALKTFRYQYSAARTAPDVTPELAAELP